MNKKILTMIVFLVAQISIAGQAHMTADSAGREYSSMPQERSEIKTHEVADKDTLDLLSFFSQQKRNVLATCDQVISNNEVAENKLSHVKTVEVVSYTSDGSDFNMATETKDYQTYFNLDCSKRPAGLRSKSECALNDKTMTIKHIKPSLFSEAVTQASYDMNTKQLRLTRTESSLRQAVIFDFILQCK